MPKFGQSSQDKIGTLDARWWPILSDAIELLDFKVICGHRDIQKQTEAFESGASTKQWPNSKHNQDPSLAVDLAPYHKTKPHIRWEHKKEFILLAGVIMAFAYDHDESVRWGGDWDQDWDQYDQTFMDIGHFELGERT
jgi:peptidoglycan L-alanyl-D-glutamate endopeptidase CwlK